MKLSFHGGIRGVTGSCYLVETSQAKILVDCGMFQGERMCGKKNYEPFGFDPKEIDAVLITHGHYDHTGRLPILVKQGFTGSVFMTPPTKALSKIILEDAQRVMAENAKKCGDPVLYEEKELKQLFDQLQGRGYHTDFEAAPGLHAMFHDAGHILGSAYITIDVKGSETKSGEPLRLLFSGDVGNDNVPILPSTEAISKADVVLCESTYGNRDHEPVEGRAKDLVEMVSKVINRGGTLIIPAFSIERTQELLYELDQLADNNILPRVPIYLDSPLAIKATEIYRHFKEYLRFDREILSSPDRDFFTFKGLRETLSRDESRKINDDHGAKIIIAGSGMMTGGRVLHHLKRYLHDPKSGVLIIGYQAEGTLGRQIEEGAERVTIYEKEIEVKATVKKMGSFSAHADRNKLAKWLVPQEGKIEKVLLVHGDEEVKPDFKQFLANKIDSEILIPEFQQEMEF